MPREQEPPRGSMDKVLNQEEIDAMVRKARTGNAAADAGQVRQGDVAPLLHALQQFEEIFAVMQDDDAAKVRTVLDWARQEGRLQEASERSIEAAKSAELTDARIEELLAEMQQARKARNFGRSDEIRAQLNAAGLIVEITKDGVRWKRK